MKKFLIILAMFLFIPVFAYSAESVVPEYVSVSDTNTFGLYQVPNEIMLYQEPSESSNFIYSINWLGAQIHPEAVKPQDVFEVYLPEKNFALMQVTDETEDWVQVIYNKKTASKGWIKKDDPYRFMSWIMFYNMYGRKYGLKLLKEVPAEAKDLHSSTDEKSQITGTINMPQKINLTAIRGNWALVSVFDIDKTPKTGYVRWRADNGVKYYFPDIK